MTHSTAKLQASDDLNKIQTSSKNPSLFPKKRPEVRTYREISLFQYRQFFIQRMFKGFFYTIQQKQLPWLCNDGILEFS